MNRQANDDTEEERRKLEAEADETRERLFEHIDELDERRVRWKTLIANLRDAAERHRVLLVGGAVGAVAGVALLAYVRRARARRRNENVLSRAVSKLLGPGYVVRSVDEEDGFVKAALTRAAAGLTSRLASELGNLAVSRFLETEERHPFKAAESAAGERVG